MKILLPEDLLNLIMAQFIKGNGQLMALGKVKASKFGEMVQNMKGIGDKIKLTAMEELFTLMGILMLESGRMIKHMAEALMNILTEQSILVIGLKINSTAMELRYGQMEVLLRVIMNLEKNMELELFNGLMEVLTLENFIVTIYTEWDYTLGKMVGNMKENGEQTKCMVMEHLSGQMVVDMLVSILKIRNKVTENSFGQMGDVIGENGKMENNTVKDRTFQVRVLNDLENGEMAKLCNGLKGNNLFENNIIL